MEYLLLAAATLSASGKALFCKVVGSSRGRGVYLANFKSFVVAAAIAAAFGLAKEGNAFLVSPFTLVLSVIFAASVFFSQLNQMKAMAEGPATLTTLIYASSFLIPIAFGAVALGEGIRPVQYVGVGLMLVSLFLMVWQKDTRKIHWRWLMFAMLAFLGSGTNAVLQKIHQASDYREELTGFLFYALILSGIFSLAVYLLHPERKLGKGNGESGFLQKLSPVPLGICVGFLNFLNLMLAGRLPSVIQFPVYNIGSLILTGVISVIAFRERLSGQKLAGFCVGVLAILLIGMF